MQANYALAFWCRRVLLWDPPIKTLQLAVN